MIKYEYANSEFYENNKNFCKQIEEEFASTNCLFDGYCNSYGFEIKTKYSYKKIEYFLELVKKQSTQNGVVIPVDAIDYYEFTLKIKGLSKEIQFEIGKSSLKRLFMKTIFKNKIPAPFYLKAKKSFTIETIDDLVSTLITNQTEKLKLSKGNLSYKTHFLSETPLEFIKLLTDKFKGK